MVIMITYHEYDDGYNMFNVYNAHKNMGTHYIRQNTVILSKINHSESTYTCFSLCPRFVSKLTNSDFIQKCPLSTVLSYTLW